jgi:uncharacterized protein YndB with AHSA1/START domain
MTDDERAIQLEVQVSGTPEEVWEAIATGPGISSWYVPHQVEERQGGAATASFGPGPEMQVHGRVAAWEPPNRIVFDSGDGAGGLAFEWLIEARDGTCIVRLVNTGFGSGGEWDGQYDGMAEGWGLFLLNLRLHLEHFRGRAATAMLPMATWPGPPDRAWASLTRALGLPAGVEVGERIRSEAPDGPALAGTVADVAPWRLALVLDDPAPGTAFIAVEGQGDEVTVSVWSYLYGPDGPSIAERDEPRWSQWLERHAAVDVS